MGAWSHNSFDNDDALDWVAELEGSPDVSVLIDALNYVTHDTQNYIEAPQCSIAIAAAEVVAAMKGKSMGSLPPEVTEWLVGKPAPKAELVTKARLAVEAVLADSELKELWEENEEDYPKWTTLLDDLRLRLS